MKNEKKKRKTYVKRENGEIMKKEERIKDERKRMKIHKVVHN